MKVHYSFTDEFGQESTLIKTYSSDVLECMETMEILVSDFEKFIISAGFTKEGLIKFMEDRYYTCDTNDC